MHPLAQEMLASDAETTWSRRPPGGGADRVVRSADPNPDGAVNTGNPAPARTAHDDWATVKARTVKSAPSPAMAAPAMAAPSMTSPSMPSPSCRCEGWRKHCRRGDRAGSGKSDDAIAQHGCCSLSVNMTSPCPGYSSRLNEPRLNARQSGMTFHRIVILLYRFLFRKTGSHFCGTCSRLRTKLRDRDRFLRQFVWRARALSRQDFYVHALHEPDIARRVRLHSA
jgi:hypothetical protein